MYPNGIFGIEYRLDVSLDGISGNGGVSGELLLVGDIVVDPRDAGRVRGKVLEGCRGTLLVLDNIVAENDSALEDAEMLSQLEPTRRISCCKLT